MTKCLIVYTRYLPMFRVTKRHIPSHRMVRMFAFPRSTNFTSVVFTPGSRVWKKRQQGKQLRLDRKVLATVLLKLYRVFVCGPC